MNNLNNNLFPFIISSIDPQNQHTVDLCQLEKFIVIARNDELTIRFVHPNPLFNDMVWTYSDPEKLLTDISSLVNQMIPIMRKGSSRKVEKMAPPHIARERLNNIENKSDRSNIVKSQEELDIEQYLKDFLNNSPFSDQNPRE